jgi:uncharacterized protein YbaR (Trm112 family)
MSRFRTSSPGNPLAAAMHLVVCPSCYGSLILGASEANEGMVVCSACERRYRVVDGILVLLPESSGLPESSAPGVSAS